MRLIDADAFLDDAMERYCKDCDRRKGIKNGKCRIIYEIGEAPCRACSVDDMKCEIEDVPTVDAIPIEYIQKEIEDLEKSLDFYGSIGEYDALRIDAMYQHDALTGLLRQWKAERKDNG